jgi:hypothetical protein
LRCLVLFSCEKQDLDGRFSASLAAVSVLYTRNHCIPRVNFAVSHEPYGNMCALVWDLGHVCSLSIQVDLMPVQAAVERP